MYPYIIQVRGAAAAVLMAFIHSLIQFSPGVLSILLYVLQDSNNIAELYAWYQLTVVLSIIGSLADFFIYLFIYRSYRSMTFRIIQHPFSPRKWQPVTFIRHMFPFRRVSATFSNNPNEFIPLREIVSAKKIRSRNNEPFELTINGIH